MPRPRHDPDRTPNDPKTEAVFHKACGADCGLKRASVSAGFTAARSAIRHAMHEAQDLRFDLAEVEDAEDRQIGVEEMNQKVGALLREGDKLLGGLERFASILAEVEREAPKIAARLGVNLEL